MNHRHQFSAYFLSSCLAATNGYALQQLPVPGAPVAPSAQSVYAAASLGASSPETPESAQQTTEQLQQLVACIALYPDALVAQVLAASTYPAQVVEADRWLQQHRGVQGTALAQAVDPQPWDPSVKGLTQFPSVLANMDQNLSWTSALGEAYVKASQDVLNAVQSMRQRALQAGSLQSNAQQTVTTHGHTILIQPASASIVYVPAYDPWMVYGAPIAPYAGWVSVPGLYVAQPGVYFGVGFSVGLFAGFAWGWPAWACDWHGRTVIYHNNVYISHNTTVIRNRLNRHDFDHGDAGHRSLQHREPDRDNAFGRGDFDREPGPRAEATAPRGNSFGSEDHAAQRPYTVPEPHNFGGHFPREGFHEVMGRR